MEKILPKGFWIQLILIITLLTAIGCEKIEIGDPNYVKIDTKYNVTNSLSFIIDSIRDYRCPKDMLCLWSGDVELYFRINHNFSSTDTLIYLWTHNNNPFSFEGYTWNIEEIYPWLESNEIIEDSEYRIKLIITKN
ncbi:MAG: hypothetical protein ACOXZQ_14140 [Bacteroidales bacterium]|jgi:hypothetical protein